MKIRSSNRPLLIGGILLLILLIAGLYTPSAAQAKKPAQQVNLASVRVQIWPEYDKPSALVIYNVSLPSTVTLPASLTMRIPATANKPSAVAWQSPDKALYEIKYETSTSGDWINVSFSTPAPDFRVEYYDPALKKTGTQRNFTFRWPGDYTVQALTLEIQKPINAANITFTPNAGPGQVSSSDGLTYYIVQAGQVNAGTTFDLNMSYTKPDDTLTSPSQFQAAQPNQPINSSTSGRVAVNQLLPWIIGGVGLLLIAGGLFWYYRTGMARTNPAHAGSKRLRHARAVEASLGSSGGAAPARTLAADDSETIFCTQCGKKAAAGDAFCRACGTKLK